MDNQLILQLANLTASANLSDGESMNTEILLEISDTPPNPFPLEGAQEPAQRGFDALSGLIMEVELHIPIYRRFLLFLLLGTHFMYKTPVFLIKIYILLAGHNYNFPRLET